MNFSHTEVFISFDEMRGQEKRGLKIDQPRWTHHNSITICNNPRQFFHPFGQLKFANGDGFCGFQILSRINVGQSN